LKENALSAGKSGADIYRPTIGFAGAMIFAGGMTLIVIMGLNIMRLITRAPKYGCKIRGMAKVGDIGYGKRLEKLENSMRWLSPRIGIPASDGLDFAEFRKAGTMCIA
jgi:hypothetical protein